LTHVVSTFVCSSDAELTDDDRLSPVEGTEPTDVSSVMDAIDNWDPTEKGRRALAQSLKAGEIEAARKLA
jgi:hypothetical protein